MTLERLDRQRGHFCISATKGVVSRHHLLIAIRIRYVKLMYAFVVVEMFFKTITVVCCSAEHWTSLCADVSRVPSQCSTSIKTIILYVRQDLNKADSRHCSKSSERHAQKSLHPKSWEVSPFGDAMQVRHATGWITPKQVLLELPLQSPSISTAGKRLSDRSRPEP